MTEGPTHQVFADAAAFRAVFEGALDAMLIFGDDMQLVDANAAACELFGRARDVLLRHSVGELFHGAADPAASWKTFLAGGTARVDREVRRPSGEIRIVEAHARAHILPGRHLSILRDITDARRSRQQLHTSQELFLTAFRASPIAMAVFEVPSARIVDLNDAAMALSGYSREDAVGRTGLELGLWADPDHRARFLAAMDGRGEVRDFHARLRRRSGELRDVTLSTQRIDVGGLPCLQIVLNDVTGQRNAERTLARTERAARVATWTWLLREDRILWSPEAHEIVGRPLPESAAEYMAMLGDGYRERAMANAAAAVERGEPFDFEHPLTGSDGMTRWLRACSHIERDASGVAVRAVGTLHDVTDARITKARLAVTDELYRRIVESTAQGVMTVDATGRLTFVNRRYAEMMGTTVDDLIGRPFLETLPAEWRERIADRRAQRRSDEVVTYDVAFVHHGARVVGEVTVSPLPGPTGAPEGALVLVSDVTARRQAEELRARLAAIVESSRDAIISRTLDGRVETWNASAEQLFGYRADEMIGRPFDLLVPVEARARFLELEQQASRGEVVAFETRRLRKDGSEVEVSVLLSPVRDAAGTIVAISSSARDLSTQKRLEASLEDTQERLRHLQKLEAIGALAGGIAHDFNNILSIILTTATLVEEQLAQHDPMREDIVQIREAGERGATLTGQLLAFSRRQVLEPRVVDVNAILLGMVNMLRRLLGERIRLEVAAEIHRTGNVLIDPAQFEQVILNLAVNARDAMPNGGDLTIDTDEVRIGNTAAAAMGVQPGAFVRVIVTDTGTGMRPEVRARVFEPFFTTKPTGKGTGLGLSTVFGIIRQSGGFVKVDSEPGRGSRFELLVPRTDRVSRAASQTQSFRAAVGDGETILLVEDEEGVRTITQRLLRREGYEVLAAANAGEALLLCERHPEVALLLTDIVMPMMNGRELAQRLTSVHPGLPVLYMSGYTDDEMLRDMLDSPDVAFLHKPVRREMLLRKIRELLDA